MDLIKKIILFQNLYKGVGEVNYTKWLENTRSWLYIDDCCKAIHKLMNCKNAINQVVNIGSNDEKVITWQNYLKELK